MQKIIKEPVFDKLPSKEDFYYDGGCDERYALNHYYGKDIDFILEECKSFIPLAIMDTFFLVGTRAFRYYVFGAFRYIQEAIETGDKEMIFESSDVLSCITNIINQHLNENPKDMEYIAIYIKNFFKWAIENYNSFDINENVYGNMKEKWKELNKTIEELYKV
ncbi:MAG TPA: hypothetical protein EYG93_07945 [Sulfurospirillum arcachonense]|nr:hypothetical protein [Sulfurospirillum arcachonense]